MSQLPEQHRTKTFNIQCGKVTVACGDLLRLISVEEKEHQAVTVSCERYYTLLQTFVEVKVKKIVRG
jgi:hypothetical protein